MNWDRKTGTPVPAGTPSEAGTAEPGKFARKTNELGSGRLTGYEPRRARVGGLGIGAEWTFDWMFSMLPGHLGGLDPFEGAGLILGGVRTIPTFVATVILFMAAAPPLEAQTPSCAERLEKPSYPLLARQAGIEGIVKVRFSVGADGKTFNVVSDGHPLLTEPVNTAINRTLIDPRCEASYDLEYRFVLNPEADDPMISVAFKPTDQFLVSANLPRVFCTSSIEVRPSWYERVFLLKKSRTVLSSTPCSLIRNPPSNPK